MQDPNPINIITTEEVRARGWIAEARDSDGHLTSMLRWVDGAPLNDNLRRMGEFISSYETDRTVTVFQDMLAEKMANLQAAA